MRIRQVVASRIPDAATRQSLRNLALMSMVAAVVAPTALVLIRGILATALGTDSAGSWDGLLRISDAYLMIFTVPLAAYFLPAFGRADDKERQRKELRLGLSFVLALLPLVALIVYALRDWLILLLYDPRFLVISDLVHIQLSADLLRMMGWVLGYFMLAREMTRHFVVADLLGAIVQVVFASQLVPVLGLAGAVWSMLGGYAVYLLFSASVVYRHVGLRYL